MSYNPNMPPKDYGEQDYLKLIEREAVARKLALQWGMSRYMEAYDQPKRDLYLKNFDGLLPEHVWAFKRKTEANFQRGDGGFEPRQLIIYVPAYHDPRQNLSKLWFQYMKGGADERIYRVDKEKLRLQNGDESGEIPIPRDLPPEEEETPQLFSKEEYTKPFYGAEEMFSIDVPARIEAISKLGQFVTDLSDGSTLITWE